MNEEREGQGEAAVPPGGPVRGGQGASSLVGASPLFAVRTISLAVREYLREYRPDAVLLAVSGGADSLAMGVCALDLAARMGIAAYCAVVDHGMRPESTGEAQEVADFLCSLGAQVRVLRAESEVGLKVRPNGEGEPAGRAAQARVAVNQSAGAAVQQEDTSAGQSFGGALETNARALRYELLVREARRLRANITAGASTNATIDILTGHTADDQAETVLLRLGQGVSAASLAAMRPRTQLADGIYLGRPLLGVRREQTRECCRALELTPVEDPTNRMDGPWRTASGGPLPRSAIREWVLPSLQEALGQDPVPALTRLAERLGEDEAALAKLTADLYEQAVRRPAESPDAAQHQTAQQKVSPQPAPPATLTLRVASLKDAPKALRMRVYRQFLAEGGAGGAGLKGTQLQAIDALVVDWHGQGAVAVPGGLAVARRVEGASPILNLEPIS